jgi:DNA-binding MarR family transcriptional regulator
VQKLSRKKGRSTKPFGSRLVKHIDHQIVKDFDYISMSNETLPSDIAPIIMQAYRLQLGAMMARLAARGFEDFTPAFTTLMPLLDATGVRSTVLAQRTGVTKQAMSQLIRLLEERDYVEQVPDATDTRAKVIRLTKRGVAIRKACVEVREELNRAAMQALGKNGLAKLQADLSKLIASYAPPKK